jgi:hypothetical protein
MAAAATQRSIPTPSIEVGEFHQISDDAARALVDRAPHAPLAFRFRVALEDFEPDGVRIVRGHVDENLDDRSMAFILVTSRFTPTVDP